MLRQLARSFTHRIFPQFVPKNEKGCRQETGTAWGKSFSRRCDQQAVFYRVESAMAIAADWPPGCGEDEAGVRATH
jgi:hypothetical protein